MIRIPSPLALDLRNYFAEYSETMRDQTGSLPPWREPWERPERNGWDEAWPIEVTDAFVACLDRSLAGMPTSVLEFWGIYQTLHSLLAWTNKSFGRQDVEIKRLATWLDALNDIVEPDGGPWYTNGGMA